MAESKEQHKIEELEEKVKILTIKGGKNHADILALQESSGGSSGGRAIQVVEWDRVASATNNFSMPAMSALASATFLITSTNDSSMSVPNGTLRAKFERSGAFSSSVIVIDATSQSQTIQNGDGGSTNGMTSVRFDLPRAVVNLTSSPFNFEFSVFTADNLSWSDISNVSNIYLIVETVSLENATSLFSS